MRVWATGSATRNGLQAPAIAATHGDSNRRRGPAHSWIWRPLGVYFLGISGCGKENIKGSWVRIGANSALSGGPNAMAGGACHSRNPPAVDCPGLVALTPMVTAAADLPSNAGAGIAVAGSACAPWDGLKE